MMHPLRWLGSRLARFLARPSRRAARPATSTPEELARALRKGDVLLVEGSSRFSTAIKYLTQSTWSHAALCVSAYSGPEDLCLLEADVNEGVRLVPLSLFAHRHTRICRPVGLRAEEIDAVTAHAMTQLGHHYDLKNVFDLARWLIQRPPVPDTWKRRLLAFGSGDPTRAICSSLIARAFQSVHYPILPERVEADPAHAVEIFEIRHHSFFTPRDFDISPYFNVIKPSIASGFDPHQIHWAPK
ncbi:MAG: YiiX/YebB-like N1pC/P60 family cysteine hydrolase [Planctomycetota bacterium]|nr:YiiX/YebB-like N1pC/P60 family cysteine hydrolase [Planctomycetota bacterium]